MPVPVVANYGRIVVLKRTGQDSASFDLTDDSYLFGRQGAKGGGAHCDIRIQLSTIAEEHCRVYRDATGRAIVENISAQGTIVNGNTLTKGHSHVFQNGDIMTVVERSFRFECDLPAKAAEHEADMICFTPIKVESLGDAQKTPLKQAPPVTPVKVALAGTTAGSSPVNRTPAKTPVKSASNTPSRPDGTPSKPLAEGKLVMTSGIVGSPMRTMKLMGSPMRVSTPIKPEQITDLINDFASESAKKTPRRLGGQQPASFEVTPVKQIEQAPPSAPREGSTVSKFNISEMSQGSPQSPAGHSLSDPTDNNPSNGLINSQLVGLTTPPPPPRHSLGSPNINLLFPPTPALAAASKLAESIAAAGSSTADTPSAKGTPAAKIAVTPTARGTPKEAAMDLDGETPLRGLESPRKAGQTPGSVSPRKTAGTPRLGTPVLGSPRKRIAESPKLAPALEAITTLDSPKVMPESPARAPATPLKQETPSAKQNPISPQILTSTAGSARGTPSATTLAISPAVNNNASTPAKLSHPHTPGRSPRFSVTSGGSPVVLDREITGSPKLKKVDFYFEPTDVGGDEPEDVTAQVYLDDGIKAADSGPDATPNAVVNVVNLDDKEEDTPLVEANFPDTIEAGKIPQPAEPIKLADQMQIDTNGPAESEQEKEADKATFTYDEGQAIGNVMEVASTTSPMEAISTTTAAATAATSGSLLTSTAINGKGLRMMDAMVLEKEAAVAFEEIESALNIVPHTEEETPDLAPDDAGIPAPSTQEAVAGSQTAASVASSMPSTPRRSTRLAVATKTPTNVEKKTPATARRKPPASTREKTPMGTKKASPATKRTPVVVEKAPTQEEEEQDEHELQKNAASTTRARTPRAASTARRTKASTTKTPATEPKVKAASSARKSARRAPATSKATTTGNNYKMSLSRGERSNEGGEEVDATSPSLHSRAARTRQKQGKGGVQGDEENNENIQVVSTNVTVTSAAVKKTPIAKRALDQVDADAVEAETDSQGRRRSTRARTPAKAH